MGEMLVYSKYRFWGGGEDLEMFVGRDRAAKIVPHHPRADQRLNRIEWHDHVSRAQPTSTPGTIFA
jgi:hypothetical protein